MNTSTAAAIRRKVDRTKPGTFLSVPDLSSDHRSKHAVEHALSRLAASDSPVLRVRKGLYYRGVVSRFGKSRPRPLDVALEVARDHGAGPAGWTALRALGITTQVPAIEEVAVVGAPPSRIGGVRFRVRSNPDRHALRFEEIAALEAARVWPTHGSHDSRDLMDAIQELAAAGRIRPGQLAKAADREPPAVRAIIASALANPAA